MSGRGRRVAALVAGVVVTLSVVGLATALVWDRREEPDVDAGTTPCAASSEVTSTAPASSTTSAAITTTTTSRTPTTSSPAATTAPVLRVGSSGPAVRALETRLAGLGYWTGAVDDVYDVETEHAVTALQKVSGIVRDGVAGPDTLAVLTDAVRPASRSTTGDLVEIDVTRQVLLLVRGGWTEAVFDVSTGKPSTPTATGRFHVTRQIDGYHRSDLGVLYRPKYFHGGQAMHGYPNVPPYPASHGCVRLTNGAIDWLWEADRVPIGSEVWVYR